MPKIHGADSSQRPRSCFATSAPGASAIRFGQFPTGTAHPYVGLDSFRGAGRRPDVALHAHASSPRPCS